MSVKTSEISPKNVAHLLCLVHNKIEQHEYLDLDDENKRRLPENEQNRIESVSSTNVMSNG